MFPIGFRTCFESSSKEIVLISFGPHSTVSGTQRGTDAESQSDIRLFSSAPPCRGGEARSLDTIYVKDTPPTLRKVMRVRRARARGSGLEKVQRVARCAGLGGESCSAMQRLHCLQTLHTCLARL